MNFIIQNFLDFIISPFIRWFMLLLMILILIYAYNQEITRYSNVKGFTGLNMNWQMYILSIIGIFGTFITFMGLWLTIPFTDKLPKYWYIPIFILILAYYTQITIDIKPISTDEKSIKDNFSPPPSHLLPQKYRLLLNYIILIIDIIIFIQFYIYFGVFDYSKNTYLHRYLLERFGGWYDGHKLAFLTEIMGLIYVLNDIYNIYLSKYFEACIFKLPSSWNF